MYVCRSEVDVSSTVWEETQLLTNTEFIWTSNSPADDSVSPPHQLLHNDQSIINVSAWNSPTISRKESNKGSDTSWHFKLFYLIFLNPHPWKKLFSHLRFEPERLVTLIDRWRCGVTVVGWASCCSTWQRPARINRSEGNRLLLPKVFASGSFPRFRNRICFTSTWSDRASAGRRSNQLAHLLANLMTVINMLA